MNGRTVLAAMGLALLLAPAAAQTRRPAASPGAAPAVGAPEAVARVGSLSIGRTEYQQRLKAMESDYRGRAGQELPRELRDFVRRQVLELIVRERLLILEAGVRGPGVSDVEAEEQMKKDPFFNPKGAFDEAKYLAFKVSNPDAWAQALAQTKQYLAGQRLQQRLQRDLAPSKSDLRARLERQMTKVGADYLALRKSEFSGAYAEPRETEILDDYRQNAAGHRTPERARLSVIFFNQPALPDSARQDARQVRAWEERMQSRADSVLRAARAGAPFETLGVRGDGLHSNLVVPRGTPPGFWGENPGWESELFGAPPGTLLPRVYNGRPGRLLVRVEEALPSAVQPLRDVAREIRNRLRLAARIEHEDRELRAFYEAKRESLATLAVRVRYAVADTATWPVREPSPVELDRYYRGHLADYATYHQAKGEIVTRPFAEVRAELAARWKAERRYDEARTASERLFNVWDRGRRDAAAERALGGARDTEPIPLGVPVDSTPAGAALADSLSSQDGQLGTGFAPWAGGFLVYRVYERVPHHVPSFEQAKSVIGARYRQARDAEDQAGARAYFDANRDQFRSGPRLFFRALPFRPLEAGDVSLTRADVEAYFNTHVNDYGIAASARIRHILISPTGPTPEADRAAKEKAESLLRRLRAGEDFAELAKQFSDDPATRNDGGDLGSFGAGVMVPDFERAAFALEPGQISDLVTTQYGYHILLCVEKKPVQVQPLVEIYTTVGYDAARARADSLARQCADSLRRVARGAKDPIAFARRHGIEIVDYWRAPGEAFSMNREMRRMEEAVESTPLGRLLPDTYKLPGTNSWAVVWVDSSAPPRQLEWGEARARALQIYRAKAGERALAAKRAELDSLVAAGWSMDSVTVLWGGAGKLNDASRGSALPGMGGKEATDSLLFGTSRTPALAPGGWSGWVQAPGGWYRLRVLDRKPPEGKELEERFTREERLTFERNLYGYFDKLKQRYPVRILDPELRKLDLPPPPEEPS